MLLLLTACYLPTTYGLRDDGLLPTGPEGTAQVTQSGLFQTASGPLPWYGAQGRFRLGPKVGLRVNGAVMPVFGSESDIWVGNAEADVLLAVAQEPADGFTGTVSLGMSAVVLASDSGALVGPGMQAGLTVSRTVARTLHPFAGVRVNPVGGLSGKGAALWTHAGGGLSWRPSIGHTAGVFAVEGGWDHGFAACLSPTRDRGSNEISLTTVACDTWFVGLSAGATFGKQAE